MMSVMNDHMLEGPPHKSRSQRTAIWFVATTIVATLFFAAPISRSLARGRSATELIESGLPAGKTMRDANKQSLLKAICRAVRKRTISPAAITSAAVTARRDLAGEIVGAVLGCSGNVNCEVVASVVSAAVTGNGNTIKISDAAMARAPNCAESIQRGTRLRAIGEGNQAEGSGRNERGARVSPTPARAGDVDPLIGTSAGANEGFDPLEPLTLVCDNGVQRALRVSLVDEFLRSHPGAVKGSCPPATPHADSSDTNQSSPGRPKPIAP